MDVVSFILKGLDPMTGAHMYVDGPCRVLVSSSKEREQIGWHFSISCADRNPTWEEQKRARYELCPDDIYMVQIMPRSWT